LHFILNTLIFDARNSFFKILFCVLLNPDFTLEWGKCCNGNRRIGDGQKACCGWEETMRITLNGEQKECPEGTTVEKLLELYKIDKNRAAVELNLQIVPRKELSVCMLNDADILEVVTFVGGG